MNDTPAVRRALPVALFAATAAAAALVAGVGPQLTDASWTVQKTLAVTATALTPAAPTALICPSSGGLLSPVPLSWTAPPGVAPTGYLLKWTGSSSGSSPWPTNSGTVNAPPLFGSINVKVYAVYGGWESPAGTQSRNVAGLLTLWSCGA